MLKGKVEFINPKNMMHHPAFTQVVVTEDPVRTIYIGGQNAVDSSGNVIGRGNLEKQTEHVLKNIKRALKAAGADLEHIIKWHIYVVEGQELEPAFEVFREQWKDIPDPPAMSLLFVKGLIHPDFLIEIEAVAAVPE